MGMAIIDYFIHKREFIVYSPLVEPMPMYGLHHLCDTGSLSIVMFDHLRWTASSLEIFESVNGHQTVEQYYN